MQTVYRLWTNNPTDLNRPPIPVPPGKIPPASSFGGTYFNTQNPLLMTQQELGAWIANNYFGNPFPKHMTVIETPVGSVVRDRSVPNPPAGTGHLPPNTPGARIIAEYDIIYDPIWGRATFRRIGGN